MSLCKYLRPYNFYSWPLCLQAIHQQLQEALEEQENLKVQTAEYARQVARVEELLAQKVSAKILFYKALVFLRVFVAQNQLCLWFSFVVNQSGKRVTQIVSFFSQIFLLLEPATYFLQGATWSKCSFPFRLTPDASFPALEAESMFSLAWNSPAASYFPELETGCIFLLLQLFSMLVHCICIRVHWLCFCLLREREKSASRWFFERVDTASLEFLLRTSFPLCDKQK